jgi:hypothetical protein
MDASDLSAARLPVVGQVISTSYVELQNLAMRMSMRRFTRLAYGFSKKVENHDHKLAIYFLYYNFCLFIRRSELPLQWEQKSLIASGLLRKW